MRGHALILPSMSKKCKTSNVCVYLFSQSCPEIEKIEQTVLVAEELTGNVTRLPLAASLANVTNLSQFRGCR